MVEYITDTSDWKEVGLKQFKSTQKVYVKQSVEDYVNNSKWINGDIFYWRNWKVQNKK